MGTFNLSQIVNPESAPVQTRVINNIVSNTLFGPEKCITPNYPRTDANTWYIGSSFRYKQFGAIEKGRNNELFVVTRAGNGHAIAGGNLYWSVSSDEGLTWASATKFTQDTVTDATSEALLDVTLTYDNLIDKYFLIYTHVYGIVGDDHSNVNSELKVWIGDEPFVNMVDVSPSVIKTNGAVGNKIFQLRTQGFHKLVRIGTSLYLPVYGKDTLEEIYHSALIKFNYNDTLPFNTGYCSWDTVKIFDSFEQGSNETTLYITYQSDGKPRLNMLTRTGDLGYLSYSDDIGANWTNYTSIGIDIAGGPQVFQIGDIYMLVAREQKLGAATIFAMFSVDGSNWKHRVELGNQGTGYPSIAHMESGKLLICYSKEYSHTGIECIRSINNLPKYEDLVTT